MRYYIGDAGFMYDALFFLSHFLGKTEEQPANPYYVEIRKRIEDDVIPQALYPLICRHQGAPSFLDMLLSQGRPFEKCTKKQISVILENRNFLYQRFTGHFFPQHDTVKLRNTIGVFPHNLEMIKQYHFDPTLELYIFCSAVYWEDVQEQLKKAYWAVYAEVELQHERFLSQTRLNPEPSTAELEKLQAISGNENARKSYHFSLSLMDPEAILFDKGDSVFYLLGSDYKKTLDEKYKFAGITPYTLAQALGNEVKYEIYKALLQKASMSRAELEKALMMSRSALEHNLNDMRSRGLVVIDRRQGNAYYFKINPDFVRVAANMLLTDVSEKA